MLLTGELFLIAALLSSLAVIFLSATTHIKFASIISLSCVLAASLCLWFAILNDNFTIAYVANYSSKSLPLMYKISAFWAGQQGSFLLWLLFHAIAGVILVVKRTPIQTLTIYYFLQLLLTLLVLWKSPFTPNEMILPDGFGLNPLLQDFWMAIHPPIIFLGYALLAVPFSMSLGSLLKEPMSRNFLESARIWTLIAWAFLGAGIFVGGYWAYKVLGWGGYWGWDPVENSSLVPWLLSAVLLHLINLAKSKPAVLLITHLAAIFTYALVIYGTFLTRSGILGDFSVHSFSESSIGVTISIVNALVLIGGLLILMSKLQQLPKGKMYESFGERAFLILLGSLMLIFVAIIVWIGMSMPLLTQLMGSPAAVDTDFYTRTTAPIALVIAILIIVTFAKFGLRSMSFGGVITHVAVLTGLAAIMLSSSGETVSVELTPKVENELLGHKVVYEGQEFQEDGSAKFYVYTVDGETVKALTKLRSNGEDAAREPAILRQLTGDIYIAPSPINPEVSEIILERNRTAMDGEYAYRFEDSEVDTDEQGNPKAVKVRVVVTDGEIVDNVTPTIEVTATGGTSKATGFFGGTKRIRLTGISGDESKIRVEILPSEEDLSTMPVSATISTKPFIWLLWLSTTAIFFGTLISLKGKETRGKG